MVILSDDAPVRQGVQIDPLFLSEPLTAAGRCCGRFSNGHKTRVDNMLGNRAKVPDNAEPGHQHQQIIRDVDLPPVKTLAGGDRVVVVVVVPTFPERYERQ